MYWHTETGSVPNALIFPSSTSAAANAVSSFVIEGLKTNLPFFHELLADASFVSGNYDTGLIDKMRS